MARGWGSGDRGGWGFPPYVSVAERRARARLELARLHKQTGRAPAPIVLEGRTLATTFWGKAWCDNLERYSDYASRLPRGRSYLRNGSVVDLVIEPGVVRARVAGSSLYTVDIAIRPLAAARWRAVKQACTGKIGSLVGLLRGQLSADVLAILAHRATGLFPEPREIEMECSCPDWAGMCKHIAATLYGVGARLDTRPELFFTLRRVDQEELLSAAATADVLAGKAGKPGKKGKQIAAAKLTALFGIELEEQPAAKRKPKPGRRRAGGGRRRSAT